MGSALARVRSRSVAFGVVAWLALSLLDTAAPQPSADIPARSADEAQAGQGQPAEMSAETRYQACVSSAKAAHATAWAAECKRLADKVNADRSNCLLTLKLPVAYCGSAYKDRDGSANCRLPDQAATLIDAALARSTHRCARELKAAVP